MYKYSHAITAISKTKLEWFRIKIVKIDIQEGFWNSKREIQQNVLPVVFLGIFKLSHQFVSIFMKPRYFGFKQYTNSEINW